MFEIENCQYVKTWPPDNVLNSVYSFPVSLDGGGKELIDSIIQDQGADCILLEIGVFLGASSLRWLQTNANCTVIGVDFWGNGWEKHIERYQNGAERWMRAVLEPLGDRVEEFKSSLIENGSLNCTLKNLEAYSDRFIPIQCDFEKHAVEIAKCVKPSIIYIDADKTEVILQLCAELFPNAIITGDDWTWGADKGFPIQKAVKKVCAEKNWSYKAERATWVISK